jgi:hypothetical protein
MIPAVAFGARSAPASRVRQAWRVISWVQVLSPDIRGTDGTDDNEEQCRQHAKLGCAPAHRLLDFSTDRRELPEPIIEIRKREGLAGSPRSFSDYVVTAHSERVPKGVELTRHAG